jgi:EAL and modified HD-GYP domain-containing signal transduction protein
MTHDMSPAVFTLAAAVDAAIPADIRAAWERSARRHSAHLIRSRVFRSCGGPFAQVVGNRCELPTQTARAGEAAARADAEALAAELRSAFRDLACGTGATTLFVPVGPEFLAGDMPVPRRPDLLVVEVDVDDARECDAVVRDGLLRVKALGCRVAIGGFTGSPHQRRLLPLADFVKVDARDLALEGQPLLDLAGSRGAQLVAEFVDTSSTLAEARAAGIPLVQGRALERRAPLARRSPLTARSGG